MSLNSVVSIIGLMAIYGITLPTGYLVAHKVSPRFFEYPFFVSLPVYIALGFITLIPIYLLIALASVNFLIPLVLLAISIIVLFTKRNVLRGPIDENNGVIFSSDNIFPLFLLCITILYFVLTIDYMKWPPAGDIITAHGPLVSLIEFNGKLPLTPSPIIILYPPGLHVAVATFNTLMDFYPAEAVFIVGASIIALIPLTIYSATFFATNSKLFSFIAFLSVLIPHPSLNLEKWIVGYFYNGPYANLAGYLIVFTFATALVALRLNFQERTWLMIRKYLLLSLLAIVSLLATYPSFAIVVAIHAVLVIVIFHNSIQKQCAFVMRRFLRSNIMQKVSLVASASILSIVFYSFASMNWHLFETAFAYFTGSYIPGGKAGEAVAYAYALPLSFFFDHINGITTIVAFPCAIYLLLKKKRTDLNLLYLPLLIMIFLSLNTTIYPYVWIIQPKRSILIASVLSWPLILMATHEAGLFSKYIKRIRISVLNRRLLIKPRGSMTQVTVALLAILLFAPSLSGYVTFEQTTRWGWFTHTPNFSDDIAALEWINTNIPFNALILNDGSHVSRYALSLSVKNLTHHLWAECTFPKRASDLFTIWRNPGDLMYMIRMLKAYNVSYIFSTSEWGYLLVGKEHGYYGKFYTPQKYAEMFDGYPFLDIVFKSGFTRIYKVVNVDLELEPLMSYDRQVANTFWSAADAWGNGTIGTPILSDSSQRINIPSGGFGAWGVYKDFDNATKLFGAQLISVSISTSAPRGFSLSIYDVYQNWTRYDFVSAKDDMTTVFMILESQSESHGKVNMTALKSLALSTGFIGPWPQAGDSLSVYEIVLYRLVKLP